MRLKAKDKKHRRLTKIITYVYKQVKCFNSSIRYADNVGKLTILM